MKRKLNDTGRKYLILLIYGIAMGAFEAIVVIYLRRIYYPEGFEFPLRLFSSKMYSIELLREFSTILMIVTVAFLSARDNLKRVAWFLYIFALWDIFYYVMLKILIGWPPSLLTWDILFLIPVAWAGPVLAPVICSATMIIMALLIIYTKEKWNKVRMAGSDWALIISGAFVIIWSFINDYFLIIIRGGSLKELIKLNENAEFHKKILQYTPLTFNWLIFAFGEILIVAGLFIFLNRALRENAE